jgi:hypothetical protein
MTNLSIIETARHLFHFSFFHFFIFSFFIFPFFNSIAEFEQFLGMRKEIEAEDEEFEF